MFLNLNKLLLVIVLMLVSHGAYSETCKHYANRMQYKLDLVVPDTDFSIAICRILGHDKTLIDEALIIASIESDFYNAISKGANDFGYFQFHKNTLKRLNIPPTVFMRDVNLQVVMYVWLMTEKKIMCRNFAVPQACWHSATRKHYLRYAKLYKLLERRLNE